MTSLSEGSSVIKYFVGWWKKKKTEYLIVHDFVEIRYNAKIYSDNWTHFVLFRSMQPTELFRNELSRLDVRAFGSRHFAIGVSQAYRFREAAGIECHQIKGNEYFLWKIIRLKINFWDLFARKLRIFLIFHNKLYKF